MLDAVQLDIFAQICVHLNEKDLNEIRFVCKRVNRQLRSEFVWMELCRAKWSHVLLKALAYRHSFQWREIFMLPKQQFPSATENDFNELVSFVEGSNWRRSASNSNECYTFFESKACTGPTNYKFKVVAEFEKITPNALYEFVLGAKSLGHHVEPFGRESMTVELLDKSNDIQYYRANVLSLLFDFLYLRSHRKRDNEWIVLKRSVSHSSVPMKPHTCRIHLNSAGIILRDRPNGGSVVVFACDISANVCAVSHFLHTMAVRITHRIIANMASLTSNYCE